MLAALLVMVTLACAEDASAGFLQGDPNGNLLYDHLATFEPNQAHDLVFESSGNTLRVTDEGTNIFICSDDTICGAAPCVQGASLHEAVCEAVAVTELRVVLGEGNDRLQNRSAKPMFACTGVGSDVVSGGSGRDAIGGGAGRDELHGGAGADSLAVDFAIQLSFGPASRPPPACQPGAPERFEVLDGGPGRDRIEAGPGDDLIEGGEDDDTLIGYGGDDRMDGGTGRDDLIGLEGNDVLYGRDAGDFLFGGPDDDDLDGGPGDDDLGRTLRYDKDGLGSGTAVATAAEDGDDRLAGGEGSDSIAAGPGDRLFNAEDPLSLLQQTGLVDRDLKSPALNGADRISGGPGDDLVSYRNRAVPVAVSLDGLPDDGSPGEGDRVDPDVERVIGGAADDVLRAAPAGSLLLGDYGADELIGGGGPDLLNGGVDGGSDRISGSGGDDELRGGPGDDTLDGGTGRDVLVAGGGDDAALGGRAADSLEGGAGADTLEGGEGADCLAGFVFPAVASPGAASCRQPGSATPAVGADGSDILRGGSGRDRLEGGPGQDLADYSGRRTRLVVVLPGGEAIPGAPAPPDELAADVEGVRGGRGHDLLIGNDQDNLLDGGPGDDQVEGGPRIDRLRGGSGRDLVVARDGDPDAIRCGTKLDLALVDDEDETVSALSDVCERVSGGGSRPGARAVRLGPAAGCRLPVRTPGAARFFLLGLSALLPPGAVADASSCAARLGRATLRLGAFQVRRRDAGGRVELLLRGGAEGSCPRPDIRVRRLAITNAPRGVAVTGRELAGAGAGAGWLTTDGCRGTRVQIRAGRVRLSADGRKPFVLERGRGHFAPARAQRGGGR